MERKQREVLGDADSEGTCPLCIEPMDDTDNSFLPCPCGYQVYLLRFLFWGPCHLCLRSESFEILLLIYTASGLRSQPYTLSNREYVSSFNLSQGVE